MTKILLGGVTSEDQALAVTLSQRGTRFGV